MSDPQGGRFPASTFGPYLREPSGEMAPGLPVPPIPAPPPRWIVAPGATRPAEPRNVLIHQARFRVGDTLWLTPLLRAIRRSFPAAAVTVVAGPLARQVLERSPHVSDLVIWDPAGGAVEQARVLDRLSESSFDTALFALARRDKSRWLAEAMAARGVPCRVNLEYVLTGSPASPPGVKTPGYVPSPSGRHHHPPGGRRQRPSWAQVRSPGFQPGVGEAEGFTHEGWFVWGTLPSPCLLLHALHPWLGDGPWTEDRRVELPVSEAERRAADRVLDAAGVGDGPFAVLAPAGHSSDRWPPERFAELAARLADEFGLSILVEGAPADEPLLRAVVARAGHPGVQAATHPLGVLAALLERARLLVANDSAPIHVAEAMGTPTLYFAHREKLVHSHPAGDACWALYDEEHNRLADISVAQALGAVNGMLRRGIAHLQ